MECSIAFTMSAVVAVELMAAVVVVVAETALAEAGPAESFHAVPTKATIIEVLVICQLPIIDVDELQSVRSMFSDRVDELSRGHSQRARQFT
jgi:hypothetical protein